VQYDEDNPVHVEQEALFEESENDKVFELGNTITWFVEKVFRRHFPSRALASHGTAGAGGCHMIRS
jgi:hypothetical protein